MSDMRKPRKPDARRPDERRPQRGAIPYALIAMVFAPLAAGYFWLLRDVEGFRFAHPFALALIPPAVALCAWAGPARALRLFARGGALGAAGGAGGAAAGSAHGAAAGDCRAGRGGAGPAAEH